MTASRGRWALLAIAAVALAGAIFLVLRPQPRPPVSPATTLPIISGNFPSPGSANLSGYRVVVDELHIDLPLVEGDGVSVPLYRAAHYPGMSLPGEGGRSLLYAHAQDGMFGNLLLHGATGQHVEVIRPGHATLHYVVTTFNKAWAPRDLTILQPVTHEELVLLTCSSYDPNAPRVVAIAEPV